jgi:peptidyl-prolyl cis-trans isomerase A (cyclophilin A)
MRLSTRSGDTESTKRGWLKTLLCGRAPGLLEHLEGRTLMAGSPLPLLTDLESPNNTVVRFETTLGDIDIELFNGAAPVTVANFLNYVTSGRFDETFLHRSSFDQAGDPFVLQGGGFAYDNTAGLSAVSTDAPIIRETTGRLNVQRTVAMARTNAINSATSQFFINYVDNDFLDPTGPNDGYAVFGRIVNDASWTVVLAIQNLDSEDLRGAPEFAGPDSSNFGEVPITGPYSTITGVRESLLVSIINAEIIKPAATDGFFEHRLTYPEGYRSGTSTETLELVNPNASTAQYQVIVRYELAGRDVVISQGSINANSRIEIRLSDFADAGLNVVRSGAPYALVVETALPSTTTAPQAISASLHRVDFNGNTSEGLFNVAGYNDTQLRTWDIPRMERNALSREFITWMSLADSTATITTTFFNDSSGTTTFTSSLEAYRRGGLDVVTLGLAAGVYSVRITSTQPIAVNLSDWDVAASGADPTTAYTPALGVLAIPGGGATRGSVAGAVIQTGHTSTLSFLNPGNTVAVMTVTYWRTGRAPTDPPITTTEFLQSGSRRDIVLNSSLLGVPVGETFSIIFSSGSTLVAAQYTQVDEVGRNQSTGKFADGIATAFTTRVGAQTHFADGRMDAARTDGSERETISIFNPFSDGAVTFTYTVRFTFSDGTVIDGATGTLTSQGRIDIVTGDITSVRAKAGSGAAFQRYSITVLGTGVEGATTTNAAGIVMLTRTDSTINRWVATIGTNSGLGLSFTDPVFGT